MLWPVAADSRDHVPDQLQSWEALEDHDIELAFVEARLGRDRGADARIGTDRDRQPESPPPDLGLLISTAMRLARKPSPASSV
jgi:hypothetical protein